MDKTIHARILNALKDGFWIKRSALVNKVFSKKTRGRTKAVNFLKKNDLIESKIQIQAGAGRNPEFLRITKKGLTRLKQALKRIDG